MKPFDFTHIIKKTLIDKLKNFLSDVPGACLEIILPIQYFFICLTSYLFKYIPGFRFSTPDIIQLERPGCSPSGHLYLPRHLPYFLLQ